MPFAPSVDVKVVATKPGKPHMPKGFPFTTIEPLGGKATMPKPDVIEDEIWLGVQPPLLGLQRVPSPRWPGHYRRHL
jgi:hypothetical protein